MNNRGTVMTEVIEVGDLIKWVWRNSFDSDTGRFGVVREYW